MPQGGGQELFFRKKLDVGTALAGGKPHATL